MEAQKYYFSTLNNWLLTPSCHDTEFDPFGPSLLSCCINEMQQSQQYEFSSFSSKINPKQAFVWKSLQCEVNSPHEFIQQHQQTASSLSAVTVKWKL